MNSIGAAAQPIIEKAYSSLSGWVLMLLAFALVVIVIYNLRFKINNWFIGLDIRIDKDVNERDVLYFDKLDHLLTKIGNQKMYFKVFEDIEKNIFKNGTKFMLHSVFVVKIVTNKGRRSAK